MYISIEKDINTKKPSITEIRNRNAAAGFGGSVILNGKQSGYNKDRKTSKYRP